MEHKKKNNRQNQKHNLPGPSQYKPSADNGTFRSVKKCFSLHSNNVKRKLDLNGSVHMEQTAIPGLYMKDFQQRES